MPSSPSRASWMGMLPAQLHGIPHAEGPLLSLTLNYCCLESLRIFGHRTLHFYLALGPKYSWTCYLPRNKVFPISGFKKHKLPKCLMTGYTSGGSYSVEFTSTIVLAKPHKSYQCSDYALGTKSRFQDLSLTKDGTSLESGLRYSWLIFRHLIHFFCFRMGLIRVSLGPGRSVDKFGAGAVSVQCPQFCLYLSKMTPPSCGDGPPRLACPTVSFCWGLTHDPRASILNPAGAAMRTQTLP